MKRYKFIFASVLSVLLLILAGCSSQSSQSAKLPKHLTNKNIPTLFIHGWGSSAHAEEYMTQGAKKAGATEAIVRATVARNGRVSFNKRIPKNAKNPIVEVEMKDNRLASQNYHHGGQYVKNVVIALAKMNKYKEVNLVGHSMGNLENIYYINDNVKAIKSGKLPRLNKLVAIAGHYNGIVGMEADADASVNKQGLPSKINDSYKPLMRLHKNFPKNTRVLNIFGDLKDGSHSDKDVPVNSAKSLKYLTTLAKSYREVEFTGPSAQHSRLHHNSRVNAAINKFLWNK